jgi:hypothetical protein
MPEIKKKAKAVLILSAAFLREAGLENIFPQINNRSCERLFVSAFDYNLGDGYFAELTLYPKRLEGESMHVFIPKHAILAIINSEDVDKTAALGFKVES